MHVTSQRLPLFSALQDVRALEVPKLDVPPVLVDDIVVELCELTDASLEDVRDSAEFATLLILPDWLEPTVLLVCACAIDTVAASATAIVKVAAGFILRHSGPEDISPLRNTGRLASKPQGYWILRLSDFNCCSSSTYSCEIVVRICSGVMRSAG